MIGRLPLQIRLRLPRGAGYGPGRITRNLEETFHMSTPAGWYPDPHAQGQQRYWDGKAWTENQAPLVQQPQPTQPAQPAWTAPQQSSTFAPAVAKQKKPFWRRTWVLVTAGVIVVFIAIGAASGSSDTKDAAAK